MPDFSPGEVTVAILAGGLGTRLRSVLADKPKALANVCGQPFLSYLFDQIAKAGFSRVVLCTGYLSEMLEKAFGNNYGNISISYSREETPLGTGGALRLALPEITTSQVLVLNGDSYVDVDLLKIYQWYRRLGPLNAQSEHSPGSGCLFGLVATEVPDTSRFGKVVTGEGGVVTGFEEKGAGHGPGAINAGIYLFPREFLQRIPGNCQVSLEREYFPGLVGKGLYAFSTRARFIDIGVPETFAEAQTFFSSKELK